MAYIIALSTLGDTQQAEPHRHPWTGVCPSFPNNCLDFSQSHNTDSGCLELFAEYLLCAAVWPVPMGFPFPPPTSDGPPAAALGKVMDDYSSANPCGHCSANRTQPISRFDLIVDDCLLLERLSSTNL